MLIHFRRHVLVLRRPRAGTLLLDKPIATPQHTVAIQHLFVFPEMQKKGVGSQLLADAEQVTKTLFPSVIQIHATVPSNIGVFFEKNGFELDALLGDNLLATKYLNVPPRSTKDGIVAPLDISRAAVSEPQNTRENTKGMAQRASYTAHGIVQRLDRVCTEEPRTLAKYCGAGAT
jgi:hypothetical protein